MRIVGTKRLLPLLAVFLYSSLYSPLSMADGDPGEQTSAAPAKPHDDNHYLLAYRFQPNQFLHYNVSHPITLDLKFDQGSMTTFNETKTRKHYRVVSVDSDGRALLETVIDHVHMTVQADDGVPIVFDSEEDSDKCPPEFQEILEAVGRPLSRAEFASNGELLALLPMKASGTGTGKETAQTKQTDELDPIQNFLVVLPQNPVKVGETWKDRFEVPVTIPSSKLQRRILLQRVYRLVSVEGDLATIALKTSVLTPAYDPQIRVQLIQRTPSGTIVFDMHDGVIVSRTLKSDRTEIDAIGPKTSMRAVSTRSEQLVDVPAVAVSNSLAQDEAGSTRN